MGLLWKRVKIVRKYFRTLFKKKIRSPQLFTPKTRYDTGELMAKHEKYQSELFLSLSTIPDEMIPELGDKIYCNAK